MYKTLLDKLFRRAKVGSFTVTYWDQTTVHYGPGEPCCHITFKDHTIAPQLLRDPVKAFGEGYMQGTVEIEGPIEEVVRLAHLNKEVFPQPAGALKLALAGLRRGSVGREKKDVQRHYDLGNDFFKLWLDESMTYSSAYFHSPQDSLEQAQEQKNDLVLKKLHLCPGERLLDIGCGWGRLVIRAAQQFQVQALGITVSEEQCKKGNQVIREMGLEDRVSVRLEHYHTLAQSGQTFDKIASVGMCEHVGRSQLPQYMADVRKLLAPGGLSLLHSITHLTEGTPNSWIATYIFPGGYIPSLRELVWLLPEHGFHLLDIESLRMHYAMTLDHWAARFEQHVSTVQERYGEQFVRMWRLYLQSCAASFRYSGLDIHQLLFSKGLNNDLPLTRHHLCT